MLATSRWQVEVCADMTRAREGTCGMPGFMSAADRHVPFPSAGGTCREVRSFPAGRAKRCSLSPLLSTTRSRTSTAHMLMSICRKSSHAALLRNRVLNLHKYHQLLTPETQVPQSNPQQFQVSRTLVWGLPRPQKHIVHWKLLSHGRNRSVLSLAPSVKPGWHAQAVKHRHMM
jgi:hypothetical protein